MDTDDKPTVLQVLGERKGVSLTSIFDEKQCQASDRQDPHSDSVVVVDVIFFSDSVADAIFLVVDAILFDDKLETLSLGFSSSSTVFPISSAASSVSCLQVKKVKKNNGWF